MLYKGIYHILSEPVIIYLPLLIYYSIYNTYTGKCVGVILVTFLLSYRPYLIIFPTYTAYLGLIRFTLANTKFTLGNMEFTLDNMEFPLGDMTPVLQFKLFE